MPAINIFALSTREKISAHIDALPKDQLKAALLDWLEQEPERVDTLEQALANVRAEGSRRLERLRAERLRAEIAEGFAELDRGESVPFDFDEIEAEAMVEYAAQGGG